MSSFLKKLGGRKSPSKTADDEFEHWRGPSVARFNGMYPFNKYDEPSNRFSPKPTELLQVPSSFSPTTANGGSGGGHGANHGVDNHYEADFDWRLSPVTHRRARDSNEYAPINGKSPSPSYNYPELGATRSRSISPLKNRNGNHNNNSVGFATPEKSRNGANNVYEQPIRSRSASKTPSKQSRKKVAAANTFDYQTMQCKAEGCSAVIIVEDARFLVCKHKLSNVSNFFRTLFIDHRAFPITGVEQLALDEYTVVVSGLRYPPAVTQFKWFLESTIPYPVLKDITEETLESLMRLSKRFQSQTLQVRCKMFIMDNVDLKPPVMAMCWLNWVLKHRFDKQCLEACMPVVARLSLVELEAHRPMITEKLLADLLAMKLRASYQQTAAVFQTIHEMDHFTTDVEQCPRCHRRRDHGKVRVYANPCQKILGCERCMSNHDACELRRRTKGTDYQAFYQCDHGVWAFSDKTEDCHCQTDLYKAQAPSLVAKLTGMSPVDEEDRRLWSRSRSRQRNDRSATSNGTLAKPGHHPSASGESS